MPFKSEAQRRFMYRQHPELAKEFEKATPEGKSLPEHVPQKMDEGGLVDTIRHAILGDKAETAVKTDANDAKAADAIDPVVTSSSDTAKGYSDGGAVDSQEIDKAQSDAMVDKNEPGLQDVTGSDFLLPYLLGPSLTKVGTEEALPALKGLGESGELSLGRSAPAMEDTVAGATTKDIIDPKKIEVYTKSIQKGAPGGSGDVIIRGVRGDPDEIAKLGYGPDPASVPEHILQQHGLLPQPGPSIPQPSPNSYAEGGKVERSSLAHPTPNAMMARAMNEGGYPHVTFLENESPATVNKVTHVEHAPHTPATSTETGEKDNPSHMAKGGTIHKAEGRDKEPAKPANVELSHEEKLRSIYKAMGMKKYADGGMAVPNDVGPSQLPSTPSPSDPGFWDTIKEALAKIGSPVTAAMAPAQAINSTVAPAVAPAAAGALNSLTGASLPVPPPNAAPAPVLPPPAAPAGPVATPPAPTAGPSAGTGVSAAPPPDLKNLFNQDTSKLTAGVNPEDRQALATKLQDTQHSLGSVIAQAVSGLGDALAAKGGKEQHSLQNIFSMQKEQRAEALANFDQARQDRLQKLDLQTKMGNNAIQGLAAQDAYGTDEHLNKILGAPPGTAHKDLGLYFQAKSAQVAQQEKDADLYMKAHSQASTDVDNAVKNASVLGIKPSAAQLQASGAKLADNYYNRAKGNILVKPSDGGPSQWIPAQNIGKAKQMDPNLQVIP